jgi:dGTPase
LEQIDRKGRGWNLCLQVLDGILCHDGEVHAPALQPKPDKTFASFDEDLAHKAADPNLPLTPMTLEGCVVRMADTIAYIGRDIEDAIRLGLIKRSDIPPDSATALGDTNGTIVYNLVTDLITNSLEKPFIAFSSEVSKALKKLRQFNLTHIYLNRKIKPDAAKIQGLFELLFKRFLLDLEKGNEASIIFTEYLHDMSADYKNTTSPPAVVRDFISGMTDEYFLRQCPEELRPQRISCGF